MQRQSSGQKPLRHLREQSRVHSGENHRRAAAKRQAERSAFLKAEGRRVEAFKAIDNALHGRHPDDLRKVEGFKPGGLGDMLRAAVARKQGGKA